MKKLSLVIFLLFLFYTEGGAQTKSQPTHHVVKPVTKASVWAHKTASIKFDRLKIDFGTIKEDAIIEKVFTFTNNGNADLVIIDAEASCGCTLPIVPKEPIKPGSKSQITVKYTAKNKVGPQKPLITVTTNGVPAIIHLQLEGWVEQIPGGIRE